MVQRVSEELNSAALRCVPDDTTAALARRVAIFARLGERRAAVGNAIGATS